MTSKVLAACVFALAAAAARPVPLDELFPAEVAAQLEAGITAKRAFRGAEGLAFFPRLAARDDAVRRVADLDATVGVEMAVAYRPAAGPGGGDRRTIYNALHAVSSLKGIEYFSVSRGRMHTFFYDAAFVESAGGEGRLPDPTFQDVPAEPAIEHRYASFDDATFGRYVVEVAYETSASAFVLGFRNVGAIRKLLIPFVQPGALLSTIVIVPLEDRIVVYGFSCVRALNVLGIVERRGEDSFTNRLAALMTWFQATYGALYR